MSGLEEKQIKTERLYKGTLLGLRRDTVQLSNGKQATREIVEHPGAVAIVAITKDKELVMVRQFRKPTGQIMLEIPAGVPKKREKGADTARRELEEETGFYAKKIRKIWQGYASPGYSNEVIHFYLAQDMYRLKQKTDEDEFVEVDLIDVEACSDMLKNGKIIDNKTMIGIIIAEKVLKGEL